jgi:hypothetical protein
MVAEPFRKRWTGDEPVGFDSSALCQAGVLLGEQPVSKAGAQCSNHCTGARYRGRGGREATALLTRHASRDGATGFDSQALCQV